MRITFIALAILLNALSCASPAAAQSAPSTPLLDTAPVRGRLLDLTPETIALLVDGKRVEIPMNTVVAVHVGGDSVGNGAAIGGGVAGFFAALLCAGVSCGAEAIPGIAFYVGIGALVGAGVDALVVEPTTVFQRTPGGAVPKASRSEYAPAPRPAVAFTWKF